MGTISENLYKTVAAVQEAAKRQLMVTDYNELFWCSEMVWGGVHQYRKVV